MRWKQIIGEDSEQFVPNPFSGSKVKSVMYHGSNTKNITKFKIPDAGLWFSDSPTWGEKIYGDNLAETYACYLDVHNIYYPTEDEIEEYYGEMEKIPGFFRELRAKGYDAYFQGGESGSLAVFPGVRIVDARTGKAL
jgi:hypothetical protein